MVRVLTSVLAFASVALASSAAAGADPTHGKAVFAQQCSTCHSDSRARPTVLGPPLYGVVGRKAGSIAGYPYSPAMRSAGFAWTEDRLRAYLPAPRDYLPGVKMSYVGLKNPAQLNDLIAYLDSLR